MNDSTDKPAQSLGEWLTIATFGLVTPARERIQLEIEAHYADAVKSRLDEGQTQAAAEAAALQELGDPKAAAKNFRKRHLTEDDEKWLHTWLKNSRTGIKWWALGFEFCTNFIGGVLLWEMLNDFPKIPKHFDWVLVIGLALYGVYVIARLRFRHFLKHSSIESGLFRELLKLDLLSQAALISFTFSILFFAIPAIPVMSVVTMRPILFCSFLLCFGIFAPKRLSLLCKLQIANDKGLPGITT